VRSNDNLPPPPEGVEIKYRMTVNPRSWRQRQVGALNAALKAAVPNQHYGNETTCLGPISLGNGYAAELGFFGEDLVVTIVPEERPGSSEPATSANDAA
jgi:hypothetical protein